MDLDEIKKIISTFQIKLNSIHETLHLNEQQEKLKKLEEKTLQDGFWENSNSNAILKQIKEIKNKLKNFTDIKIQLSDINDLIELLSLEHDEQLEEQLSNLNQKVRKELEKFEIQTLLSGKYDNHNAIITLHPGAGGTESQDWAEMLYRMYCRWANRNHFTVKELDYLEGDEAGIKSVTALIEGENVYGYLKAEHGVHRLVRISPFDAGGRRHTSFASLEVLPEITDDIEIDINPVDLRIDTYRSSGAGGQHINKTDSAVRITHIPTGIVTSCQSERSQIQNKETAMKMLKSKLLDLKEKENKEKIEDLKGIQKDIAWGSQIRSYVFCPYTLVKDHRTNYEVGNIEAVMNGEIDEFMEAYLKQNIK